MGILRHNTWPATHVFPLLCFWYSLACFVPFTFKWTIIRIFYSIVFPLSLCSTFMQLNQFEVRYKYIMVANGRPGALERVVGGTAARSEDTCGIREIYHHIAQFPTSYPRTYNRTYLNLTEATLCHVCHWESVLLCESLNCQSDELPNIEFELGLGTSTLINILFKRIATLHIYN